MNAKMKKSPTIVSNFRHSSEFGVLSVWFDAHRLIMMRKLVMSVTTRRSIWLDWRNIGRGLSSGLMDMVIDRKASETPVISDPLEMKPSATFR